MRVRFNDTKTKLPEAESTNGSVDGFLRRRPKRSWEAEFARFERLSEEKGVSPESTEEQEEARPVA